MLFSLTAAAGFSCLGKLLSVSLYYTLGVLIK